MLQAAGTAAWRERLEENDRERHEDKEGEEGENEEDGENEEEEEEEEGEGGRRTGGAGGRTRRRTQGEGQGEGQGGRDGQGQKKKTGGRQGGMDEANKPRTERPVTANGRTMHSGLGAGQGGTTMYRVLKQGCTWAALWFVVPLFASHPSSSSRPRGPISNLLELAAACHPKKNKK